MRSLAIAAALGVALLAAPRARACGSGSPTATADLLLGPALLLTAVDLAFTVYALPFIPPVRALSVAQVAVSAPQAVLYFTLAARGAAYDQGSRPVYLGLAIFNTLLAAGGIYSLAQTERALALAPVPGGAALAGRF